MNNTYGVIDNIYIPVFLISTGLSSLEMLTLTMINFLKTLKYVR